MKILVIVAHPNLDSFSHALAQEARVALEQNGHEVRIKDLYAEGFQPVLGSRDLEMMYRGETPEDIAREQEMVKEADALIFSYPIWWFDRPAILKGWIDRVFSYGFAYSFTGGRPQGLLQHTKSLVLITTGNSEETTTQQNAVDLIQRPMTDGTLRFCGIQDAQAIVYFGLPTSAEEQRKTWLDKLNAQLSTW